MRTRAALAAAVVILWSLSLGSVQSSLAKGKAPTLHLAGAAGFRIAVSGDGWAPRSRVAFSVRAGPWVEGMALQTTAAGTFRIGIRNTELCGGSSFRARDLRGHSAVVYGPALKCPAPFSPPKPVVTVLLGTRLRIETKHSANRARGTVQEIRLLAPGARTETLHLGDALYLWEPGTVRPAFRASANSRYLELIGQGRTPPRACPQVDCEEGYYWEWIAVTTGTTFIDLSPACRESRPACAIPDFAIRVQILG